MDHDMTAVPERVAEILEAFARYLRGEGPAPDFDDLDDETLDLVDALLPAVAELVGDRIVASDDTTESAVGVTVVGAHLRAARERSSLTSQELAVRVSASGQTIGATNVEALESSLETSVAPAVAAALADVLGVGIDELTPKPDDPARALIDEIKWGHAAADVHLDPILVSTDAEPVHRLVATDYGLVVRVLAFDTPDVTDLRGDPYLAAARGVADLDGGTTSWFLLVAFRDPELATQPVYVTDLREVARVPAGDRVQGAFRHPLVLHDAVAMAFEEVARSSWDDEDVADFVMADFDMADLAATCARLGIQKATKSTPRTEAKRDGFATIADRDTAVLQQMLLAVSDNRLAAGDEFRSSFDDELVGAT